MLQPDQQLLSLIKAAIFGCLRHELAFPHSIGLVAQLLLHCSPDCALVHLHFDGNGAHGLAGVPADDVPDILGDGRRFAVTPPLMFFSVDVEALRGTPCSKEFIKLAFHNINRVICKLVVLDYLLCSHSGAQSIDYDCSNLLLTLHLSNWGSVCV